MTERELPYWPPTEPTRIDTLLAELDQLRVRTTAAAPLDMDQLEKDAEATGAKPGP